MTRRASAVELTPHTWHALARVYRPLGQRIQQVDGHLADAERRTLVVAMSQLTAVFEGTRSLLTDQADSGTPNG